MHLSIYGSSALAPLFQLAADAFNSQNGTNVVVIPTYSKDGIDKLRQGIADIALSDVVPSKVDDLHDYQVAVIPATLFVSQDLQQGSVNNLSIPNLQILYDGHTHLWSDIGGPTGIPVDALNRDEGSGTRQILQGILGIQFPPGGYSTAFDLVKAARSIGKGVIGYAALSDIIQLASLDKSVKTTLAPICIQTSTGTGAARATDIADGQYPFWGLEHAYTLKSVKDLPLVAQRFMRYVCYGDFQAKDLLYSGYLPLTAVPDRVLQTQFPAISNIEDCGAKVFGELANSPG